jgi:tetratricopeptide (TPR) repeat protein
MMMDKVVKVMVLSCLALSSMNGLADYPQKESDFAALPPYCKARLFDGNKSPQYQKWNQRMGKETFLHVHHYCAALFTINLAYRDPAQRDYLLKHALGNIGYMETHAPMSSRLMPEMLVKKGKVLQMQGRGPEAMMAFHSSINLNKKYSPAYMAIADYYISTEQYDEAMEITEKGLKLVPKSKGLKRRQEKIASKQAPQAKADDAAGKAPEEE